MFRRRWKGQKFDISAVIILKCLLLLVNSLLSIFCGDGKKTFPCFINLADRNLSWRGKAPQLVEKKIFAYSLILTLAMNALWICCTYQEHSFWLFMKKISYLWTKWMTVIVLFSCTRLSLWLCVYNENKI